MSQIQLSKSIDVMMSKPGLYEVQTFSGAITFVEVADGKCYSLTRRMIRDNELPTGGWNVPNIAGIIGPIPRNILELRFISLGWM